MAVLSARRPSFPLHRDHGDLLSCRQSLVVVRVGLARPGRCRHHAVRGGRVIGVLRRRPSVVPPRRTSLLMAQPFDLEARQTKGDAFPIAEHVSREGSRYVGASVSESGALVYAHGDSRAAEAVDMARSRGPRPRHAGRRRPVPSSSSSRFRPMNSASPSRLATGRPPNLDIWIIDLARQGRSITPDVRPGSRCVASVVADGTHIAFRASDPERSPCVRNWSTKRGR